MSREQDRFPWQGYDIFLDALDQCFMAAARQIAAAYAAFEDDIPNDREPVLAENKNSTAW